MCVIVMYKLSVGYAKFFCDFFASTASFRQNSAEFSAKSAGNRLPNFQKIRPIIRLIRPNFVCPKIFCFFHTSVVFSAEFSRFLPIFF
jgi:hypothetical protein